MIGKYKIIALFACRIQDVESHDFIPRLNGKLNKMGYRLIIFNTCFVTPQGEESIDPQLSIYNLIDSSYIDAVIIQSDRFNNSIVCEGIIKRCLDMNLPVISLGSSYEKCINIRYQHQTGFKETITHLIEHHNIRDLHLISGLKGNIYSDEREEIFIETLKEYNIPFDQSMISYGDFWPLPARACVEKLIKENRLPKGFVCSNDNMAIAVTEVLIENGIRVPEDIAVTGFDCIDAIYSSEPTITSANINPKISADTIFETICKALNGEIKEGDISLCSEILINESCGCKSVVKKNLTPYLNEQVSRFCQYQDDAINLSEVGARIQTCDTFDDVAKLMHENGIMSSMCCLLKKEFINEKVDPLRIHEIGYGDSLYLLYDHDKYKEKMNIGVEFSPYMISSKILVPNLDYYLESGRSVVFTALHYLNVPLGYLVFHFDNDDVSNYYKIPQIVNTLNNGLGGLRNLRHNQYLMKQIDELYRTDALTGLYNRRGFLIEYDKLLKIKKSSLSVIMVDLDGLKGINDNYGHEEGDIAIATVAKALKAVCPKNSIITRFGGDEMLVVYDGYIDENNITIALNKYLNEYNKTSNKPYKVASSIGVYHTKPFEILTFAELVKCADELMYVNKIKNRL